MRKFLKGFKYAWSGIIHCVKNERNMRIHMAAALYVLIFARFFAFSRSEYAVLLLTIGGVCSAETVNTSVEILCNKVSKKRDPYIRAAKDAAAGAVLIFAFFAVMIALFLFGDIDGWKKMYYFYITHPINAAALILLCPVSLIFIIKGPSKIAGFSKRMMRKLFKRKK